MDAKSLDAIQAKLQHANEEKGAGQEVTTLQQEENVSISGSNARLMIMKKLSRKSEVHVMCPTCEYMWSRVTRLVAEWHKEVVHVCIVDSMYCVEVHYDVWYAGM